jgi:hypothetical protein
MRCGHTPAAIHHQDHHGLGVDHPACPMDFGIDSGACLISRPVDLTGRVARCHGTDERPSSLGLAFFEYCGPGSASAAMCATCGMVDYTHADIHPHTGRRLRRDGHPYTPRGDRGWDLYYCGHAGWD